MKFIKYLVLTMIFSSAAIYCAKDNTLLIINYNHPHYQSIPLLQKIYEPYFKNIVFYGPTQDPRVNLCQHHMGYLSYLTISDAMQRYPDYDSYLFLMDDCILSTWLLDNLDDSKIWYASIGFLNNCSMGAPADLTKGSQAIFWDWWNTPWGCGPMTNAYNELPEKYKKTLAENYGPHTVVAAFSDVVHIPSTYKNEFIELAQIFGKHRAFLETALPTMVSCFSLRSDWIPLHGNSTYGPGYVNAYSDFKPDAHFNHPIKLSFKDNRAFVEQTFETYIDKD